MMDIGSFRSRDCTGSTRRSFLRTAGSAASAWGLSAVMSERSALAADASAKSVMMVWLWGGPSHLDTFDPKPEAPDNVRGPFATIATRSPGVRFTELVPRLAQRSDKFSVVRSTRLSGNHDMLALTGKRGGSSQEPNFGSIVSALRGSHSTLPPFVSVVPQTELGHGFRSVVVPGFGAGRLGAAHNPFVVRCTSTGQAQVPNLTLVDGMSPERLADRRTVCDGLDRLQRQLDSAAFEQWNKRNSLAYELLSSKQAFAAFDLSRESSKTRAAYGKTSFGQSLLLGRRLVESGVPYVHVNWSMGVDGLQEGSNMGWDTHRNGFGQLLNYHCPIFDRAFAALLDDLDDRGLLESTLVVATGEMGRTPKINQTGGRDHWPTCSTLWAGGGVRGGQIIGKTDAIGGEPVTKPHSSLAIGTTIAESIGLDSQARAEARILSGGEVIEELF